MDTHSTAPLTTLDPALCWRAVEARDRAADGRFVTGVLTTGVYCRPSCPARPPLRRNVRFFASPAEAEAAGLRACLRCRPLAIEGREPLADKVATVARALAAEPERPPLLRDLAREAGVSPFHLQRAFTAIMGVSPKAFHASVRFAAFKAALRDGEDVLEAAFAAGYGSTSRAYGAAAAGLGMTPSAYRAGAADEEIVYAVRAVRLGYLLMAATARGVCAASLGDDPAALEAELAAEFPKARLIPAGEAAEGPLSAWIAALEAHLDRGGPAPGLPLDLRGTAFQVRVWRFLIATKPGQTVSYKALAEGVGAPRGARAAASACAANRIAVLAPCHRALRGDGAIGGYRWGVARKRALLDLERER